MRASIPLLTILSATLVAAAPAPFSGHGPVVAARTENLALSNPHLGRRDDEVVQKFDEEALKLRGVLLATRSEMSQDNANANAGAANAENAAGAANGKAQDQAAQDAAAEGQDQGKGKGKKAEDQAAQDAAQGKQCSILDLGRFSDIT